ncbi:hypothetical protein [Marinobacter sp. VGCF2001]|uniref:hypothetical protein n=1 Tax=Marinobacter sp. VGCF2001 TaxID=3417189 RepID=UPI003CFB9357
MTVFFAIISLILLISGALLFWQVREQRNMIAEMLESEDIPDTDHDPELVLTLRIRDPIAVAKRESRAGRILADRLPVMARKMVYQEVVRELEQELEERDIEVEMHVEYR